MNELIKINYESDRPTVLARDLHEFLEVGTPYDKWFPRMCEYGFADGEDYSTFLSNSPHHRHGERDLYASAQRERQTGETVFFTNRKSMERSRYDNGKST